MRFRDLLTLLVLVSAFTLIPKPVVADDEATDCVLAERQTHNQPAAMVQSRNGGLLPVSNRGILLNPDGLSVQDAREYLQIDIGALDPIGTVGAKYGYKAVTDAAKIAVALKDIWMDARLNVITVTGAGTATSHEYVLEPKRGGIKVIWGHAIGFEGKDEADALIKVERLARFVRDNSPEYGFLPSESTVLDLRSATGPSLTNVVD